MESAKKIQKIKLIQRKFRNYLSLNKVRAYNRQAIEIYKNKIEVNDPNQEEFMEKYRNESQIIQMIPYELWVQILEFIGYHNEILNFSQVCLMFNQISKLNLIWKKITFFKFPKVYYSSIQSKNIQNQIDENIKINTKDEEEIDIKDDDESQSQKSDDSMQIELDEKTEIQIANQINWNNLYQVKFTLLKGFKQIINDLTKKKNDGNKMYALQKNQEAIAIYISAIEYLKDIKKYVKDYEEIQNQQLTIAFLKIQCILFSNASQVELKLENYPKSLIYATKASKLMKEIKITLNNKEQFEKEFQELEIKINHRRLLAWDNLPLQLYQYSPQPVQGLQVGSLITHQGFSDGIFGDSKVLMTHFDRNEIIGVIINKQITIRGGEVIKVGGPCEMSKITTLHTIPNIPNSKRVLEGLWTGGDVTQYENNPEYKIFQYYGYASWFPGQLEGEILNANGWTLTNEYTTQQLLNQTDIISMNS